MTKKPKSKGLSLYANLTARRRSKADAKARQKAEYLATLPKQPLKRLLYRLHPKRLATFWFSKQGALTALKLLGVGIIIMAIFVAALFAYYRRELDAFSPEQLAKSVQTTVSKYYDRNGELLWEDKGEGNYKLVVESNEIAPVMKQATIAIEDKDFYKHGGISITAIARATLANLTGGTVQGASTLTQQLIKQVFFAQDAQANRLDWSRKLKEAILSIEAERMYTKEQILTLYLNEVPYGGRRNGVESAARTYFGASAKELTLPQAALLAAIPQNPSYYNPYTLTPQASKDLISRQHLVLSDMREQGYITKEQEEEAKKVPILDTIKPELSADENIKAPWFVLAVREQLEQQFGTKVVREGGLTVKTTLDWRIQQKAQESINANFRYATAINANNMAFTAVDVPTGQVLAMVGSHDYNDKTLGAVNAATAPLNPGSSIKPFVYANLLKPQQGQNWGAGSILMDVDIRSWYGSEMQNFNGQFWGPMSLRSALALSRNPPAIQAARVSGLDASIQTIKDAGNRFYCNNIDYGLSAAIGTCAVTQVQHTNAYATLGRQGVYKPESYILEVKNAQDQILTQWKDDQSKRVLDPQITYILSDILTDDSARARVFGLRATGFTVPGVKTATKTGTTDDGKGSPKDSWMMSYSPRMAVGVWTGRNDNKALAQRLDSTANARVVSEVQSFAHSEIFAKDGSWKTNDWFSRPAGIQTLSIGGHSDIFPSWYTKPANSDGERVEFDQVSKRVATDCTPARARVTHTVQVYQDPVTKQTTKRAPDGFNPNETDNVHKCDDIKPFATVNVTGSGSNVTINITVNQGTFPLSSVSVSVDGREIANQPVSGSGPINPIHYTFEGSGQHTVTVTVIDQGMYEGTASTQKTVSRNNDNDDAARPPGRRNNWAG